MISDQNQALRIGRGAVVLIFAASLALSARPLARMGKRWTERVLAKERWEEIKRTNSEEMASSGEPAVWLKRPAS